MSTLTVAYQLKSVEHWAETAGHDWNIGGVPGPDRKGSGIRNSALFVGHGPALAAECIRTRDWYAIIIKLFGVEGV